MSHTNRKRGSQGWLIWYIPLLLLELAALIAILMYGKNIAILNPKGAIASEQLSLLIVTSIVLFGVAVPTVLLLYFMAWKYRESNPKAKRNPDARHGKFFVFSIWAIPTIVMLALLPVMYLSTHKLEPRKAIASDKKPITIQVVSLRWKWVFLYPDQQVATVNFLQIPEDTPVVFELTADEAPMSSFWIPNLGGQLYSMTGHVNRLHLIAGTVGDYMGSSAEINGEGFAGMKFTTRVSSSEDFERWAAEIRATADVLDAAAYKTLLKPSENTPSALYASYQADLYSTIVAKYAGSHKGHTTGHEGHE